MLFTPARALSALRLFLLFAVFAGIARADLVWDAKNGWRFVGGVLDGTQLSGPEGRNALDAMNKARASEEKGSRGAARKQYESIAKKYPNSIYAPEALYRAARLREKNHQYTKAFDRYQDVVTRYPATNHFNEIIGDQYRIATALVDGVRPRYFGIIPGFKKRAKGIEYFEKIIVTAPYSDYAPLSLMNVARGHQKLGNPDDAIDALDRMINSYPQSLLAPDAYLKLGQAHASLVTGPAYDQASTREAITYFEDFMILFPGDGGVAAAEKGQADMKAVLARSKLVIGDFYFYKRSNYTAARVFYNEAITSYPDSKVAELARKRLDQVDARENRRNSPTPPSQQRGKRFWLL